MEYQEIIHFWFEEIDAEQHFMNDKEFDQMLQARFGQIHQEVRQGEKSFWRENITGRLAEIIVLDQFSRNIFRGKPDSFAHDGMSLALAQEALKTGEVSSLTSIQKGFLYMPFMHSESRIIHQTAMKLFSEPQLEIYLTFEIKHRDIIERFGRYPHRNKILGRKSTEEEILFLQESNSSF